MKKFYDSKLNKQLVSILLIAAMLLSYFPLPTYAAEVDTTELITEPSADSETVETTAAAEETAETEPSEEATETTAAEETTAPEETAGTEETEETSTPEETEETSVPEVTAAPEETTEETTVPEETTAPEETEETTEPEETEETAKPAILVFEEGRTTFTGAQFQAWGEQNGISFDGCITADDSVTMQNALILLSHTEPAYYQNAVILVPAGSLDLTGAVLMEDEAQTLLTYCGLGSDAFPFQGTIACIDGSALTITLHSSLFHALSTAAIPTALTLCGSTGSAPIFARAVTGSGTAYWDITLAPSGSIGGVIGRLDASFVYSSLNLSGNIAISSDGDAGLFVNTMSRGARLQIPAMTIGSPAVSIRGVNAGGLVGSANHAFIGIGAAPTSAVISGLAVTLTEGLTVNGSSAGSLFGHLTTTPAALGLDLTQICAEESTDAVMTAAEVIEEVIEAEAAEAAETAVSTALEEQLTGAARTAFASILSGSYSGTPVGTLTIADESTTYLTLYYLDLNAPTQPSVPPFVLTDDQILSGEEFAAWAESSRVSVDNSGETLTITANGEIERMLAVLSHTDPAYYQHAVILSPVNNIDLSMPVMIGENEIFFRGLGSADAPFGGQLKHTAGEMLNITLSRSLFNTLSAGAVPTALELCGSGAGALFAENICGSWPSGQAGWQIFAAPTGNIGGLIGSLAENASFVIHFFSVSGATIVGSPNAGLFCNTMHSGSSLIVEDYLSSETGVFISAGDTGSAGFAVGLMESSAKLQIPAMTIGSAATTITGANAGGLVGSATHAFIGIGAAPTNIAISGSAVTLADGLTVTGSNSGGLFGQLTASPDALGVDQVAAPVSAVMSVAEEADFELAAADIEPDGAVMALAEIETAEEEADTETPLEQTLIFAALSTFAAILSEDSSYPGSPVGMLTVADETATYLSLSGLELMAGFSPFSLEDGLLSGEDFETWAAANTDIVTVSHSGDALSITANGETSAAIETVLTVLSHTNPAYYQNATIYTLANTANLSGSITIDETTLSYQGLGSAEFPFKGQLKHVNTTLNIALGSSLFNALSAEAAPTLLNLSGSSEGALFAETVIGAWPEGQDGWEISAVPAGTIGGLIGSLAEDASFVIKSLSLSERSVTIISRPNAGLFCNTLNRGSSLTVENYTPTAIDTVSITANGGSAGFAVGLMDTGAKLQIPAVSLGNPAVTIAGTNAGGLVGSVTDAYIGIGAEPTEGSAISGDTITLSSGVRILGVQNAGSLFGRLTLSDSTSITSLGSSFALTGNGLNAGQAAFVQGTGVNSNVGGLIGRLDTQHNFSIIGSNTINVELHGDQSSSTAIIGGIIGYAITSAESRPTIDIHDFALQYSAKNDGSSFGAYYFGGLICRLGDGRNGIFLNAENCTLTTATPWCRNTNYGGVVSEVKKNSFLRVDGFTLDTQGNPWINGAGIAAFVEDNAAVCLAGTIDLSRVLYANTASGQLIGSQKNSLIYAENGITLRRGGGQDNGISRTDIGTYGAVIRLGGNLPENFITIENGMAKISSDAAWEVVGNTVQLANTQQFAAYAIALQSGNVFKPNGVNDSALSHISLTGDVNLSGTGIMGLNRDNVSTAYTYTFDGNGYTLTLGIGEVWGTTANNYGSKMRADGRMLAHDNTHRYYGLFSAIGSGAVVQNLTLAGTMRVGRGNTDLMGAGAVAGLTPDFSDGIILRNITCSVKIDYDSNSNGSNTNTGGLIGYANNDTINLSNICFDDAGLKYAGANNAGGLLGSRWLNTEVYFGDGSNTGITVTNNSSVTTTGEVAGLCYEASGYWMVPENGIVMERATIATKSGTVGLLVNSGTELYLELTHSASYKLGSDNNGTGIQIVGAPIGFDEFVYRTANGNDIFNNEAGIISIATEQNNDGTYKKLNAEGVFAYANKTEYGKSASPNTLSRYYYNLHAYRDNNYRKEHNDAGQALLLWSVYHYAKTSLKKYFPVADGSTSGYTFWNNRIGYHLSSNVAPESTEIDLAGYSYYPINVSVGNFVINAGVKIIFDREHLHLQDAASNQHYMMHGGLIHNLNSTIIERTASNHPSPSQYPVTLSGSVAFSSEYSGALVCGSLSSGNATTPSNHTIQNFILDDLYLYGYAGERNHALLVNKIGSYTNAYFYNIKTASTSMYRERTVSGNWYAASSLIGTVGDRNATKINLLFGDIDSNNKGIVLDGRSSAGQFNPTYGTCRSIFKNALFLDSFTYDTESSGIYNFVKANEPNVTYGKEITESLRNPEAQTQYYGSSEKTVWGSFTSFSTGFRPYVFSGENGQNKTHEIDVNLTPLLLTEGCGTYGDPYIIRSSSQLQMLSAYLSSNEGANRAKNWAINFPNSYEDTAAVPNHVTFTYNGTRWLNGTTDKDNAQLLTHLRKAYYKIEADEPITLPSQYAGLSADSTPFRGVILGKEGTQIILTGETDASPLVKYAKGTVIKGLSVTVQKSVTLDSSAAYGALIGTIQGGDNVIDGVTVSYSNDVSISTSQQTNQQTKPIGGMIGLVEFGGVIFRNITGSLTPPIAGNADSNNNYYWNPYIGRVVNGYAISENCTVENGDKNYKIPKLDQSPEVKLRYSSGTFTVSTQQDMYLLSAIMNSYTANGYQTNAFTRGMDSYENIGSVPRPETAKADENSVPYLMRRYATNAPYYNLGSVTVELTADVDVSGYGTGFRGLTQRYNRGSVNSNGILHGNNHTLTVAMVVNDHDINSKDSFRVEGFGLLNKFSGSADNLTVVGTFTTNIDTPAGLVVGRLTGSGSTMNHITVCNATLTSTQTQGGDDNGRIGSIIGLLENSGTASNLIVTDTTLVGNTVGGVIGQTRTPATVSNITVSNITVNGRLAGGLVGYLKGGQIETANLENVILSGKSRTGGAVGMVAYGNATISDIHFNSGSIASTDWGCNVGGIVGRSADTLTMQNCTIGTLQGERITVTSNTGSWGGGLVGSHSTNQTLLVDGCAVVNLTLKDNGGSGGFVGQSGSKPTINLRNCRLENAEISGSNNSAAILGTNDCGPGSGLHLNAFNILIKDMTSAHRDPGIVAAHSNDGIFKVVGLSVQNSQPQKTFRDPNKVSADSYVVYADYTGVADGNGTEPKVVTNPIHRINDDLVLTGDSAAMYNEATTMPMHIYNAATSDNAYENEHRSYSSALKTRFLEDKLTSYHTRNEDTNIPDFPLLLVDKNKSEDINTLIADYLNLLTDGGWKTVNKSTSASITTYVYDNSRFTATDTPTLSFNSGKFGGGIGSDADGGFTLLTISIPDPTDGSVPMILHVPVFVIRPVIVTFDADILSGFHFLDDRFNGDNVSTLIESDNRATLRLCYTYEYNWSELYANDSSKLDWTFKKVVNAGATDNALPNGTRLTLIDPQSGSIAYTKTLTEASGLNLTGELFSGWQPKTIKALIEGAPKTEEPLTSIREVYYLVIEAPPTVEYSRTTFGIPDDDLAAENAFPYTLAYNVQKQPAAGKTPEKAAELTIYHSASLTAKRQSDSVNDEVVGDFKAVTYDDTIRVTVDTTVNAPNIIFGQKAARYLQFDLNMIQGHSDSTTSPIKCPSGTRINASFYTLGDNNVETPIDASSVSQQLTDDSALIRVNLNKNIVTLPRLVNDGQATIKVRVKLDISLPQSANVIPSALLNNNAPTDYVKFDGTVSMAEDPAQTVGKKAATFSSGDGAVNGTGYYLDVKSFATMRLDATDVFQLGINPASPEETEYGTARIDAIATIDASQVAKMPDAMTYTLTLLKKADDGKYYTVTDSQSHIGSVTINRQPATFGGNGWTVSGDFSNKQRLFSVPVSVEVNRSVRDYANYQLMLTVTFSVSGSLFSLNDYIIYTYSRIPLDLNLSLLSQPALRSKN